MKLQDVAGDVCFSQFQADLGTFMTRLSNILEQSLKEPKQFLFFKITLALECLKYSKLASKKLIVIDLIAIFAFCQLYQWRLAKLEY